MTRLRSDKLEIVALARKWGGHRYVMVESPPSQSGRERHSFRAQMFRDDWLGFRRELPTGAGPHRVGRWISVGETEAVTRWRIEDGSSFVDVHLESGDKYDDAVSLWP